MYEIQDAYSSGMYVSLTCSKCPMVAVTPNRSVINCPIGISDNWKKMHEAYYPGHSVGRFVHYVA